MEMESVIKLLFFKHPSFIYVAKRAAYERFLAFCQAIVRLRHCQWRQDCVGLDEDAFAAPLLAPQKCGRFQRERMKQTGVLLWSLGAIHLQIIFPFKTPQKSADGFDASVKKLISRGWVNWSLSKEEILFQLTRRQNQRRSLAWIEARWCTVPAVRVNCRFSCTANQPPNCFLIMVTLN